MQALPRRRGPRSRCVEPLFRVASLMLRDADPAEDADPGRYRAGLARPPSARDPGRFHAWLHRLVVNACYDEARRHRRRAHVSLAAVDVSLADETSHVLERQRIEHAFRRVPMDQRAVLVLHNHLQISHSEIARALACPGDREVADRARSGCAASVVGGRRPARPRDEQEDGMNGPTSAATR